MGLLDSSQTFTHESIIGTTFRGRIARTTTVGEYSAIVPEIEGDAYITGEHTFFIDDSDPLRFGFRL
jgi:proline racemase